MVTAGVMQIGWATKDSKFLNYVCSMLLLSCVQVTVKMAFCCNGKPSVEAILIAKVAVNLNPPSN